MSEVRRSSLQFRSGRPSNSFREVAACLLAVLLAGPPLQAQQQQSIHPPGLSGLASDNQDRVAAPATVIEDVLRKEPGLLVELKRWAAKEATDRGQIVEDSILTEQGIFDRLEHDLGFRAAATRLLQRYGYLLPKAAPGSEAAWEEDLLTRERRRSLQLALAEEEKSTGAAEKATAPRQKNTVQPVPPASELAPSGAPLRNPLEGPEPGSRRPLQPRAEGQPGLTPAPGSVPGSVTPLSWDDGRAEVEAELRERGTVSPAPPETAPARVASPTAVIASPNGAENNPLRPAIVHLPNPFADIPSLYDLYTQVSPRPLKLERFGQEVFRTGTADTSQLPMDLPVGPDYMVGPGDGLAIDLWGGVAQRLYRIVDRQGRLSLPEVGPMLVSGRTLGELQQEVQKLLRTQYRDVSADVSLSRLRTVRVYMVGDVREAGAYDISSLSTPLNALFAAGGPTAEGSLRTLRHHRGKQLIQEVDLYDLLLRGVHSDLKRLENGDTVQVPPIGPQVTIEGTVRRPAIYELRGEKTLAEVLELAGGILPTAALRHIEVQRIEAHQKRTMLSLDIADPLGSEEVNRQLQSFRVQDRDQIHIFPIAPYNPDAIYVQGHVLRPGRYSFQPGMRLTDLISSHKDLLPEPALRYAEIIRLNPPDHRLSVESFDLGAALANPASAPKLQPLDTVRIFGRYDFANVPTVVVSGEVRHPGNYRTSGETHMRDAIYLAGALTPEASLDTAQLIRILPDGHLKILSINLREALAGNPLDNILLQPRDRILVHRNPASVDPPSVYIRGEVAKPGRYPLTTNLRVEDLIRLAGGLKRSAYPEAADLIRHLAQGAQEQIDEHAEINIPGALAGDPNHDFLLRDGDVLTIRQLPGWNDIGASVAVQGEVNHPGVYGIRAGERLSWVLKRAGGFRPSAFPQAAILERVEVRQLQEKSRQELILRTEQETASVKVSLSESAKDQAELQQAGLQQRERVLAALRSAPVTGRLVIHLTNDLVAFAKSPDDIELRAGDSIYVPKRPQFVVISGQVYNSNAITFEPGKTANWYLQRAGGPTRLADKKAIFVVRANGSVVSGKGEGWWVGGVWSARIEPGDTIIVPEKAIGGSPFWKNVLAVAQVAQAAALTSLVVKK